MHDQTEAIRRALVRQINTDAKSREELAMAYGQVWSTEELSRDFDVQGFAAPFVVVARKSDGVVGSLQFQHSPRYYYAFQPDR